MKLTQWFWWRRSIKGSNLFSLFAIISHWRSVWTIFNSHHTRTLCAKLNWPRFINIARKCFLSERCRTYERSRPDKGVWRVQYDLFNYLFVIYMETSQFLWTFAGRLRLLSLRQSEKRKIFEPLRNCVQIKKTGSECTTDVYVLILHDWMAHLLRKKRQTSLTIPRFVVAGFKLPTYNLLVKCSTMHDHRLFPDWRHRSILCLCLCACTCNTRSQYL